MKFDDFKMRVYWIVDTYISPVVSWNQYSPVFSIFWGGNIFVYALYLHLGPCQGCASLWGDQAPHTGLGSLYKAEQSLHVVLPVALQCVPRRVPAAAQQHWDLQAVGEQIVEILQ